MYDTQVTRFKGGLINASDSGIFSDLYIPERITKMHEYPQDFDQFIAADWTLTLNAGTAALAAGDGGLLLLTTVASNFVSVQKTPTHYVLQKGFRSWFQARLNVDNILGAVIAGLINVTAAPFTPANITDGIYFLTDGTGALSGIVAVGGVKTTVALGSLLVGGSLATLSWYYDGGVYAAAPNGRIIFEVKGAGVSVSARGSVVLPAGTTFPAATNLTTTVGVSATTAAVRTLSVDLLYPIKDRENINATPAF
jgi:hypothetical protein